MPRMLSCTESVSYTHLDVYKRQISSVVADAIAPQMSEGDQEVIRYINEVVTPNSSTINPPAPDGASEVYDLIDKLEERLCYGEITAKEAAQELFEQGNKIMAQ